MRKIGRIQISTDQDHARYVASTNPRGFSIDRLVPVGCPLRTVEQYNPWGESEIGEDDVVNGTIPEEAEGFVYLDVEKGIGGRASSVIQFYQIR